MFVDKQTPQEVNKTLAYSITLMFKNLDPLDQELMTFPTSTAKFVQIQMKKIVYHMETNKSPKLNSSNFYSKQKPILGQNSQLLKIS